MRETDFLPKNLSFNAWHWCEETNLFTFSLWYSTNHVDGSNK